MLFSSERLINFVRMKTGKVIRNTVLWTLGTVVGLVLLVLVTLQVLLRPKVLTRIVNRVAAEYVEGEVNFSEVKAHVIKSFPYLHLEAGNCSVTYPHSRYARYDSLYTESSRRFSLMKAGWQRPEIPGQAGKDGQNGQAGKDGQNGRAGKDEKQAGKERQDTLASFRRLDVELNYVALLGGTIHIHSLTLTRPRIFAHYYDSTAANWDILPIGGSAAPSETTERKETTAKPLPAIKLREIHLTDRPFIVFTNPKDTLHGLFTMRRLNLDGKLETEDCFGTI